MQAVPTSGQPPSSPTAASSLENNLGLLSSKKSVLGYLILSRTDPIGIIRTSGAIFEGERGRKYATVITRIVETIKAGLEEVQAADEADELRFLRMRTRRHEVIVAPDSHHILAVVNDPMS